MKMKILSLRKQNKTSLFCDEKIKIKNQYSDMLLQSEMNEVENLYSELRIKLKKLLEQTLKFPKMQSKKYMNISGKRYR